MDPISNLTNNREQWVARVREAPRLIEKQRYELMVNKVQDILKSKTLEIIEQEGEIETVLGQSYWLIFLVPGLEVTFGDKRMTVLDMVRECEPSQYLTKRSAAALIMTLRVYTDSYVYSKDGKVYEGKESVDTLVQGVTIYHICRTQAGDRPLVVPAEVVTRCMQVHLQSFSEASSLCKYVTVKRFYPSVVFVEGDARSEIICTHRFSGTYHLVKEALNDISVVVPVEVQSAFEAFCVSRKLEYSNQTIYLRDIIVYGFNTLREHTQRVRDVAGRVEGTIVSPGDSLGLALVLSDKAELSDVVVHKCSPTGLKNLSITQVLQRQYERHSSTSKTVRKKKVTLLLSYVAAFMTEEDWDLVDKMTRYKVVIIDDRYFFRSKRMTVILGSNTVGLGFATQDEKVIVSDDSVTLYTQNLLQAPDMVLNGYDKGVEFLRVMQPSRKWILPNHIYLSGLEKSHQAKVYYNSMLYGHVKSLLDGAPSYYYECGRVEHSIRESSGRFYYNRTTYRGQAPPGSGVQRFLYKGNEYFVRLRVGEETVFSTHVGCVTWLDLDVERTLIFERGDDLVVVKGEKEYVFPYKAYRDSHDKEEFKRYGEFLAIALPLIKGGKYDLRELYCE